MSECKPNHCRYLYDKGNYDNLRYELRLDWEGYLGNRGIQKQWEAFTNVFQEKIDSCIPRSNNACIKKNKGYNTPVDPSLLVKIKRKNRL